MYNHAVHPRVRQWTEYALLTLCALAFLKGSWDLGRVLLLEWQGAIDSDSQLYFTVARGVLNGLTPYKDLFESKPPGMFLLAIVSLLLGGSEFLLLIAQIDILLLIPGLLGWFAWQKAQEENLPPIRRMLVTALAVVLGIFLSLYLEERAGGIQTESFGSFASLLYMLCFLRFGDRLQRGRIVLLSVLLLLTIGLKEPFLLAILSCVLLLVSSRKQFLLGLLLPLGIAAGAGLLILLLTGWLMPYFTVYIPSMLGGRVSANLLEPLWLRGFMMGRVFSNLTTYYTAPLLGYTLASLWVLVPVMRTRELSPLKTGLTAVTSLVSYYIMTFGSLFVIRTLAIGQGMEVRPDFIPVSDFLFGLLFLGWVGLLYAMVRSKLLTELALSIGALYLSTLAISLSIFANNHFAFGVPMYLALSLLFIRYAASESRAFLLSGSIGLIIIAGIFLYTPREEHLKLLRERMGYTATESRPYADKVDAMLESCKVDRYYGFSTFQRLAFAKHSPIGPLFHMHFFQYIGLDHPLYNKTIANIGEIAPIVIVYKDGWFEGFNGSVLAPVFTKDPPECAKQFLPLPDTEVFFRKTLWPTINP